MTELPEWCITNTMPDRDSFQEKHCRNLRGLADGVLLIAPQVQRLQQVLTELDVVMARFHAQASQAAKDLEAGLIPAERVPVLFTSGTVAAEALLALTEELHKLYADSLHPNVSTLKAATAALESTLPLGPAAVGTSQQR